MQQSQFKRKYPAPGKNCFGLDKYPHFQSIRTLEALDISFLHVILVAPIWKKKESAVAWLEDTSLEGRWTWLALNLDGEAFGNEELHTSRGDSGQRSFERDQVSIKWERVRLLHEGLKLGDSGERKIVDFVLHGELRDAPTMNYADLVARQVTEGAKVFP